MNLYIVRHAIAVQRGTPGHDDDSQCPLTDNGRKKMKKIVQGLHQLDIELDTILPSPYVRARDTAKILANEFKVENPEHVRYVREDVLETYLRDNQLAYKCNQMENMNRRNQMRKNNRSTCRIA